MWVVVLQWVKNAKTNRPSAGESEEASFIFQHCRPSLRSDVDVINAIRLPYSFKQFENFTRSLVRA